MLSVENTLYMHVSAIMHILPGYRGTYIWGGGGGVCTFGALQPTANIRKKWRGTYFRRGTYLRGFTVSWFSLVTLPWLLACCEVVWAPWRHKSSHVPVFGRLFDRLPVRISTSDLHHRILRKKLYHIRAYDFGVQFSFKLRFNRLNHFRAAKKDGSVGVFFFFLTNSGDYLVGKDLIFNSNWWKLLWKRWWLNYNHFQNFPLGKGHIWAKLKKKLKLTSPHVREPDYCHHYNSFVKLECGLSAVHTTVATGHSVKSVALVTWFERPSAKRMMMNAFETSLRCSLFTLSLIFFFLCRSTCVSASPVKVSRSRDNL